MKILFVCVVTEFLFMKNVNYLIKYGYITVPTVSDNILDSMMKKEETFKQGIKNLQKEAGLEETGTNH